MFIPLPPAGEPSVPRVCTMNRGAWLALLGACFCLQRWVLLFSSVPQIAANRLEAALRAHPVGCCGVRSGGSIGRVWDYGRY